MDSKEFDEYDKDNINTNKAVGNYVEKYFAPYLKVKERGLGTSRSYYSKINNGIILTFF